MRCVVLNYAVGPYFSLSFKINLYFYLLFNLTFLINCRKKLLINKCVLFINCGLGTIYHIIIIIIIIPLFLLLFLSLVLRSPSGG